MQQRLRRYCFTCYLSNWTIPDELPNEDIAYLCGQEEICPKTGRRHWQCYVRFNKPIRLAAAQQSLDIGNSHMMACDGDEESNIRYCSKKKTRAPDGVFKEVGERIKQGKRTDLLDACESLKIGGYKRVAEEHPHVFVKYHRGFKELERTLEKHDEYDLVLKPWQKKIYNVLKLDYASYNDRTIHWAWEEEGNVGKSALTKYLIVNDDALVLSGKIHDMAYAYNKQPIVVFNIAKSSEQYYEHCYGFAEALKDGYLFSGKYDKGQITFRPPAVIFFANFPPPHWKWTKGRVEEWNLKKMIDDETNGDENPPSPSIMDVEDD